MNTTHAADEPGVHLIALSLLPGVGPVLARQLLVHAGNAEAVFRLKERDLKRIPGIGAERARMILRSDTLDRAAKELEFIRKNNIRIRSFQEKDYPRRLRQCADAPVLLYSLGEFDVNPSRTLAIVGTRYLTPRSREWLESFVEQLIPCHVHIISGLAYGTDAVAHRSAVRYGIPTVGVLAHGLDRLYPSEHRSLSQQMVMNGGLLTEYPSRTRPMRDNFPARNRIVAGLCDAVLVVESAERGGALITAEFANDYNRDVFAVPGRPEDHYSQGCNRLIRSHKAHLIESAQQLAEAMDWRTAVLKPSVQLPIFPELTPEQQEVIESLRATGRQHLDEIAWRMSKPVSRVSVLLLELEFKGLVRTQPGKWFECRV